MQQRYSYDLSGMKIIADKCEVTVASDDDYYGDYYYEENGIFGEEIYYEDVKVPSSNSMDIYVSEATLEKILQNLRDPNYYQASLFFKNDTAADKSISELREGGYYAVTSDHTVSNNGEKILMAFIAVFTVGGWLITLLFLSLFLYICSARAIVAKRGDIAIMRSMGIEVKVIKMSMYVYTALTMIPSFIVLAVAAIVVYTLPKLNPLFPFLHAWQYAMIVLGMILINLYISTKYNKKMFKDSVRKTLRGGAKE
jgi:ABC-type lipoprotein release transport system permease subunit